MILDPQPNGRFCMLMNPITFRVQATSWKHGTIEDMLESIEHYQKNADLPLEKAAIKGLRKALKEAGYEPEGH